MGKKLLIARNFVILLYQLPKIKNFNIHDIGIYYFMFIKL